ncbi:hypothetical protein [Tissierella sp. P1]|uniref:hypothetical protein n=1 Tax=Tissierella sp. P1 TaxID=1280483 RepID=UPI001914C237|nr:hypothetical protein [Tissierella sp. P1]
MKKSINKDKYGFILIVLFLVLILSIGFFAVIGTANISSIDTFRIVGSKLPIIKNI